MAGSSKAQDAAQLPAGAMEIKAEKANLFPLYSLIARRRIRYTPFFAVIVLIAVTISVAVSFLVTTVIARNVESITARVEQGALPFDGLMVFSSEGALNSFLEGDYRQLSHKINVTQVPCLKVESTVGPLYLLGDGVDLPDDTIELFFPISPSQTKGESNPQIIAWHMNEYGPLVELQWQHINVNSNQSEEHSPLYGWASVNPSTIENIPGFLPGVILEVDEGFSTSKGTVLAEIENKRYGASIIVSPFSGQTSLEKAAKGAFSIMHVVSILVLMATAVAITCVLIVAFLDRKRPLGIMRVLGGTTSDLARMMFVEAAYMGIPGIILGVFGGRYLTTFLEQGMTLPWSAYAVSILIGSVTIIAGVLIPVRLIKNANCHQLLNDRRVYLDSNPSCASCGLCGGI